VGGVGGVPHENEVAGVPALVGKVLELQPGSLVACVGQPQPVPAEVLGEELLEQPQGRLGTQRIEPEAGPRLQRRLDDERAAGGGNR
jgi:hypothetical protein